MKRMPSRDQRAVVIRCTATKVQPADDNPAKNSQVAWKAFQARSGFTNRPITNTSAPTTNSTPVVRKSDRGSGRLVADRTSWREKTRGECIMEYRAWRRARAVSGRGGWG